MCLHSHNIFISHIFHLPLERQVLVNSFWELQIYSSLIVVSFCSFPPFYKIQVGFCFVSFVFSRATPMAYGGSQAGGLIRAVAAAYATATATPDPS